MKNNPRFSKLLESYQQGKLVGEEKQLMDEWFECMEKSNIHPLWTADEKFALKNRIMNNIYTNQYKHKHVVKMPSLLIWQIAASVALIAFIFFFGVKPTTETVSLARNISVSSANGSVNKVLLSDGSIVWLKNNSALTYPAKFDGSTRNVILQGEALFEVAKDAKHPFIIQCGELITTVLGTSFNIKSTDNNVEVVVLTGKVSLTSAKSTTPDSIVNLFIVPNEKAVYNRGAKQLAKMSSAKEEVLAAVNGTEYNMHFEDTRMDEIIGRIEGKFNMHVSLENARIGNCVVTADFTDQSLSKTLGILSSVLSIEYKVEKDTITLYGNGCNK